MIEAVAKNIATAIFIVCALIVGSLFPEKEQSEPTSAAIVTNISSEESSDS